MQASRRRKRVCVWMKSVVGKLVADLNIDSYSRLVMFRRLEREGVPFLTVTLPKFSNFLLNCLREGRILTREETRNLGLTAFEWKGRSPRFLRGLLREAILGSADAVYRVRQLCDYFYKTAFAFTAKQLADAEDKYVSTEKEVAGSTISIEWREQMRRAFEHLLPGVARSAISAVLGGDRPRFGPGAFAESGFLPQRYGVGYESYKRLPTKNIGSHPRHLGALSGYFRSYPSSREMLVPRDVRKQATVLFVPKDSRGPRVISKEELLLLPPQMAVQDWLSSALEKETRKRINFQDQKVNQRLSYEGSLNGDWCTLDLKDASDRVKYSLCLSVFRNAPALRYALRHFRSTTAVLPSGRKITLHKLANMGSGLCFGVLALIVWLSVVVAVSTEHRIPLKEAAKDVYVYGDDIIVKSQYYGAATLGLVNSGLKVNTLKSFHKGFFRESCGADYYHGTEVSPVRLRLSGEGLDVVSRYRDGFVPLETDSGVLQLERHCRELINHGCSNLAEYYYSKIEQSLKVRLPFVSYESSVLGRYNPSVLCGYSTPVHAFVPVVETEFNRRACSYKGVARFLKSGESQGSPWHRTPLRRQVKLRYGVVEPAKLLTFGLPEVPDEFVKSVKRFSSGLPEEQLD